MQTTFRKDSVQGSKCQACGNETLEIVLDLGYQPLCNEFSPQSEPPRPETFYPLCLCHCSVCFLVQLNYVIPTDRTFGNQYTYLTGSSNSLVDYFSDLASRLVEHFQLRPDDAVLDIGCNDGTFLKAFQSLGLTVLGVEGAKQPQEIATSAGVPTLNQFFGKGISLDVKNHFAQSAGLRMITAMNVLAHTDNINEFLDEVVSLMEADTVFVSQSHWLVALVQKFEFDTVYHEHLRYYTLASLSRLFAQHGLTIFHAETTDFYGGSVLVYAAKTPTAFQGDLSSVIEEENQTDIIQSLESMKTELLQNKSEILKLLVDLKMSGKRVIGIGAPMKASTLLNFYGITCDMIEYVAEVNHLKVGTLIPGVRIPVIDENLVFENQPDYAIVLSWNMADRIMSSYRSMGYSGKFILPVPKVQVVE